MKKIIAVSILSLCAAQHAGAQNWQTTGNFAAGTDFLGTTNNVPMIFKVNNNISGRIESGTIGSGANGNTSVGYLGLNSLTSGSGNSAFGYNALYSNANGAYNTAVGHTALYSNTSAVFNTAMGYQSLYNTTTGGSNTAVGSQAMYTNTTGYNNTAHGSQTLYSNTTGAGNTAAGNSALHDNTTGGSNTAVGNIALRFNTTGNYNTATGSDALVINTTGNNNTANGWACLYGNTNGSNNTAMGAGAMNGNNTGSYNTATGGNALKSNTSGYNNSAVGYQSLTFNSSGAGNAASGYLAMFGNTTGSNSAGFGGYALYNQTTGSNNVALGYAAYPTSTTAIVNWMGLGYGIGGGVSASNMVELGNSSVTSIRQQVASTIISDGRIKDNVKANVPGLEFINRLRPVTYNLNIHHQNEMIYKGKESMQADWSGKYDIEKMTMSGFIAQEVEKAAKDAGYEFSGVDKPATPDGLYGIRYSDFVMPLVKSVQELSAANETLKKQNDDLQAKFDELKAMVTEMSHSLSMCCSNYQPTKTGTVQNTDGGQSAILDQNFPNPFSDATVIRCSVPGTYSVAVVKVFSTTGSEVMSFPVQQTGASTFTIHGGSLAAGMYQYSLIVDGKMIDTRKMVLTK